MRWILILLLITVPASAAGGTIIQTQSVLPTQTNWSDRRLVFSLFDPSMGTLTDVTVTMDVLARIDFLMSFTSSATIYLATTVTNDTVILSDPAAVAKLADGPTAMLSGPAGMPPLSGTLPVSVRILTAASGIFSSMLSPTDPGYIRPAIQSGGLASLDIGAGDQQLLSGFVGMGVFDLVGAATAYSIVVVEGGNGSGAIDTAVGLDVTLTYQFTPAQSLVDEPSGLVLLGMGVFVLVVVMARRMEVFPKGIRRRSPESRKSCRD